MEFASQGITAYLATVARSVGTSDPARVGCKPFGLNFLEYFLQPVQHLVQQRRRNVECRLDADGACFRIRPRDQYAAAKQARSTS